MLNGISKLNDKFKVIIIILYTAILVLATLLILNHGSTGNYVDEYTNQAYNDHIRITIKVKEDRESTYKTKKDYETATYYMTGFAQKGENYKKAEYSNIKYFITGETSSGKISFDESSSVYSMSSANTSGTNASSSISSAKIFNRKITVENDKVVDNNNIPAKIYIKVVYTIKYNETTTTEDGVTQYKYNSSSKNEVKEITSFLNYSFDLTQTKDINFGEFETRTIKNDEVSNTSDPIDLKVEAVFTNEETKSGSVKSDTFTITPSLNNPNLNGKKFESFKMEIFGKVENDVKDKDNLFEDYIRIYTASGCEITSTSVKIAKTEVDEKYDLSELYVLCSVKLLDDNGNSSVVEFKYKIELK